MKLIAFLLLPRGGSTLWNFVNGNGDVSFCAGLKHKEVISDKRTLNPDVKQVVIKNWTGMGNPFYLPTIPNNDCIATYGILTKRQVNKVLESKLPTDKLCINTNIGNWWGEIPGSKVPGPYPSRYSSNNLKKLPVEKKVFVHLVRDGRNQAESLIHVPGGLEEERYRTDKVDYFIFQSKGFRNRARVMIDNQVNMENFEIFKFEDFIRDPVDISCRMYDFVGLVPDREFMKKAYQLTKEKNTIKQHSSFGSGRNINKRWVDWPNWKKDTFKEIAGKELIELGYEKDDNW